MVKLVDQLLAQDGIEGPDIDSCVDVVVSLYKTGVRSYLRSSCRHEFEANTLGCWEV